MAIYRVLINDREYQVDAENTSTAIKIALDEYEAGSPIDPDNCENDITTQSISVIAEFSGDLISAPVPSP